MLNMMRFGEPKSAPGKPTTSIPRLQGPSDAGVHGADPAPCSNDLAIGCVSDGDQARVAGYAPRRYRGNACPILQLGLAQLSVFLQGVGIHMQHHLIPLGPGTAHHPVAIPVAEAGRKGANDRPDRIAGVEIPHPPAGLPGIADEDPQGGGKEPPHEEGGEQHDGPGEEELDPQNGA